MDALAKLELYDTLFYVSLGVAIFGFVLAVLFFFLFRIPQLFALSTGRAQKKTMEQMRRQGETSGSIRQGKAAKESRSYAASVVEDRGRTEEIAAATSADPGERQTTLLDADQTTLLDADQTTVLEATETSVLRRDKPETTVLKGLSPTGRREESGRTTSLSPEPADDRKYHFEITEEIVFVHTEETL